MIESVNEKMRKDLRLIADMVVLNGSLEFCPGLVHGKTGIALFLFHYSRYSGDKMFEQYAINLIADIQDQLFVNGAVNYEQGLSGIAAGIDYLIRNEYLRANENIFADIDQRMYHAVMNDTWLDFSLYEGITGFGKYWMMRIYDSDATDLAIKSLLHIVSLIKDKNDMTLTENADIYHFLFDLSQLDKYTKYFQKIELSPVNLRDGFTRLKISNVGNIINKLHCEYYFRQSYIEDASVAIQKLSEIDIEKPPTSFGLIQGYAGEGMMRLTALNEINTSWTFLL